MWLTTDRSRVCNSAGLDFRVDSATTRVRRPSRKIKGRAPFASGGTFDAVQTIHA